MLRFWALAERAEFVPGARVHTFALRHAAVRLSSKSEVLT